MYNDIYKHLQRPSIYKQSDWDFWNDEHISAQMLKAHLDPDFEGASRSLIFIEQSVVWIKEAIPPSEYRKLIDIGCGPGLYAERFCKAGYEVTGIDFSKRSIDYATTSSIEQELGITYLYQDYLKMDMHNVFDFATFIYCDYGALSAENRSVILRKIYDSLRGGGKLLLDVFSLKRYNEFRESKTWEDCVNGGFWNPQKYLALNGNYKYTENVTLRQTTVITDSKIKNYYLWDCYFTKESLIREMQKVGFKIVEILGDVAGTPYTKESPTIAFLLEK